MLATSCDHAEKQLVFNMIEVVEEHNLCNFGAMPLKHWKVISIFVSEPRFHVADLRPIFTSP